MKSLIDNTFLYRAKHNKVGITIWVFVVVVSAFNAIAHDPLMTYDSSAHLANIRAYSEGRFPSVNDSYEYHSPTLPYIIPAASYAFLNRNGESIETAFSNSQFLAWFEDHFLFSFQDRNLGISVKVYQLFLFFVSSLSAFLVAKIAKLIKPNEAIFQTFSLIIIASLPVYYRSHAFPRGEALLALFGLLLLFFCIKLMRYPSNSKWSLVWIGVICGLASLSRQQGLVYGPAFSAMLLVFAWTGRISWRKLILWTSGVAAVALAIAALFYAQYFVQNGNSFRFQHEAYSEYAPEFSFANQPPKFYISLSLDELFTDPVRPSFLNQLFPITYSDTYGDYHSHFLVYGRNIDTGEIVFPSKVQNMYIDSFYFKNSTFPPSWLETNRLTINSYLGIANIASLPHFAILVIGMFVIAADTGKVIFRRTDGNTHDVLILFLVALNIAIFLYATILINTYEGEAIKASYIVQIFPLASFPGAAFMLKLRHVLKKRFKYVILFLVIQFAIATPLFITRYFSWG